MGAWLLQQQADIQIQLQRLAVFFAPDTEEVHRHWLRFVQKVGPPRHRLGGMLVLQPLLPSLGTCCLQQPLAEA